MSIFHAAAALAVLLPFASAAQAQKFPSRYGGHFVTTPGPRGIIRWVPDAKPTAETPDAATGWQSTPSNASTHRDAKSDARFGGHFAIGAGARGVARWVPAPSTTALAQRGPGSRPRQQPADPSAIAATDARPARSNARCNCSMMSAAAMGEMGKSSSGGSYDSRGHRVTGGAG